VPLDLHRHSTVAPHGRRLRAHDDPHAALLERLAHVRGRERLLVRDQPIAALDQRDLRPERRERVGHLDADDAAAEDEEAPGHGLRRRDLAVGPRLGIAQAVDRRDQRIAAGRHDDRALRDQLVIADRDPALAGDAPGAAHDRDVAVAEPRKHPAVVEVVDHLVAATQHGPHIEVAADRLRGAGDPPRLVDDVGRAQQGLRGHAGVERALAADQMALDERDVHVALTQAPRDDFSGRTGPDHDHVELSLAHALAS
jgi:hypothetical protein